MSAVSASEDAQVFEHACVECVLRARPSLYRETLRRVEVARRLLARTLFFFVAFRKLLLDQDLAEGDLP